MIDVQRWLRKLLLFLTFSHHLFSLPFCGSFAMKRLRTRTPSKPILEKEFSSETIQMCDRSVDVQNIQNESFPCDSSASCTCSFCGTSFVSRNALFKHLRSSTDLCPLAAEDKRILELGVSAMDLPKQTVIIQFGYLISCHPCRGNVSANEAAVEAVQKAFVSSLQLLGHVETQGVTYASAAQLRHVTLTQDAHCNAASDVMIINFRSTIALDNNWLREQMQATLRTQLKEDGVEIDVRVLQVELTRSNAEIHGEKDCTQRIYHYLLPIHWLNGGEDATDWLLQRPNTRKPTTGTLDALGICHPQPSSEDCTPEVVMMLKDVLAQASSRTASNRKERRSAKILAAGDNHSTTHATALMTSPGRFGALWRKERRCFHNFCDRTMRGLASPNSETVWRTIDRARSVDVIAFPTHKGNTELALAIEFRGDSFLKEEVRRILASTIAICNGWLPPDFFEKATRPDVIIETPIAPEGRMYLSGARYHFQESENNLFRFNCRSCSSNEWLRDLQDQLLRRRNTEELLAYEEAWLNHLKDVQAPRIRAQLEKIAKEDKQRAIRIEQEINKVAIQKKGEVVPIASQLLIDQVPTVYQTTLSLLRQVSLKGQWPATSTARAQVIRASPGLCTSSSKNNVNTSLSIQSGSFTVVNEDLFDGPRPLGNTLFPELVNAIFELEAELACLSPMLAEGAVPDGDHLFRGIRRPSSHCAVNRNAEFKPHVDSGRGEGQSLSLIVGLGNFIGGGLVVEGKPYDVRYKPLEFDGWRQIHYTESFQGEERFSLVWFTPEKRDYTLPRKRI